MEKINLLRLSGNEIEIYLKNYTRKQTICSGRRGVVVCLLLSAENFHIFCHISHLLPWESNEITPLCFIRIHTHRNSGTTASASEYLLLNLRKTRKLTAAVAVAYLEISTNYFSVYEISLPFTAMRFLRDESSAICCGWRETFFPFFSIVVLASKKERIHHQTEWMAKRPTRQLFCSITVMSRAMSSTRQEENRISSHSTWLEHPKIPIIAQHREWLISVSRAN